MIIMKFESNTASGKAFGTQKAVYHLSDFEFWSGGKDTVKDLTQDELKQIETMLEDIYPDGITEMTLNDFFWFERDTIAEWLGYCSFVEIMER